MYCNQKGIRLLQQSPCIYSHFKVILLWLQQQKAQQAQQAHRQQAYKVTQQ
nr:MAG TPA: hypothetical protein [Siphoviridae sp. ctqkP4]